MNQAEDRGWKFYFLSEAGVDFVYGLSLFEGFVEDLSS